IDVPAGANGVMDMAVALKALAGRGLTRLLVEGGSRLAAALMLARLVDRIEWFRSGLVVGGDGLPAISALGVEALDKAPMLLLKATRRLGDDTLSSYLV